MSDGMEYSGTESHACNPFSGLSEQKFRLAEMFVGDIVKWNEFLRDFRHSNPGQVVNLSGVDLAALAATNAQLAGRKAMKLCAKETARYGSLRIKTVRDIEGVNLHGATLTGISLPREFRVSRLCHLRECPGVLVITQGVREAVVSARRKVTDINPAASLLQTKERLIPPPQERVARYTFGRSLVIVDRGEGKKPRFFEATSGELPLVLKRLAVKSLDPCTVRGILALANQQAYHDERWSQMADRLTVRFIKKFPELFASTPPQPRKPTTGSGVATPYRAAAAPA